MPASFLLVGVDRVRVGSRLSQGRGWVGVGSRLSQRDVRIKTDRRLTFTDGTEAAVGKHLQPAAATAVPTGLDAVDPVVVLAVQVQVPEVLVAVHDTLSGCRCCLPHDAACCVASVRACACAYEFVGEWAFVRVSVCVKRSMHLRTYVRE